MGRSVPRSSSSPDVVSVRAVLSRRCVLHATQFYCIHPRACLHSISPQCPIGVPACAPVHERACPDVRACLRRGSAWCASVRAAACLGVRCVLRTPVRTRVSVRARHCLACTPVSPSLQASVLVGACLCRFCTVRTLTVGLSSGLHPRLAHRRHSLRSCLRCTHSDYLMNPTNGSIHRVLFRVLMAPRSEMDLKSTTQNGLTGSIGLCSMGTTDSLPSKLLERGVGSTGQG